MSNAIRLNPDKLSSDGEKLLQFLNSRIIGQDEALKQVAINLEKNRKASLFIGGPPGTGKSSLVAALAEYYFGNVRAYFKLDAQSWDNFKINQWSLDKYDFCRMHQLDFAADDAEHEKRIHQKTVLMDLANELAAKKSSREFKAVALLIRNVEKRFAKVDALPSEYDPVNVDYHSICCVEEIERGKSRLRQFILGWLDDRLLLGEEGVVSFRNSIIIVTSNLGRGMVGKLCDSGFGFNPQTPDGEKIADLIRAKIERSFSSNFLNSFDDVIIFKQLAKADLINILERKLAAINLPIDLQIDSATKDFIVEEAGKGTGDLVRSLQKIFYRVLQRPLLSMLESEQLRSGDRVGVKLENNQLCLYKENRAITSGK